MDVVLLFPGQGSQKPGMGKDLADAFPAARAVFDQVDEALGEAFSTLCFDGPADTLTLTHNAQPALLAHGAAARAVAAGPLAGRVRAAAGHSLGEFTAYHAAGSLPLQDAARLVRRRGTLMYEAGLARPGTMAALLGEPREPIDALCAKATADPLGGLVVPANYNSPEQVVISGEVAGVEKGMELARNAGVKHTLRLNVSGAFHSPLMAPARDRLAESIEASAFGEPGLPVYANVTAGPIRDAGSARRLLVEQLTAPVRWSESINQLAADFPDALFVEMGPGSVLTKLMKKIAPQLQTMSCGTAREVETLVARIT